MMSLTDLTLDYMKRHLESKDVQWLHEVEEIDFTDIIDKVLAEAEKYDYSPAYTESDEAYNYVESIIQDWKESDEWSKFVYDTLDERRDHRESQRSPITYYNAHPKQI